MAFQAFPLTEDHVQTMLEAIKDAAMPDVTVLCGTLSEFNQRVSFNLFIGIMELELIMCSQQ